MTVKSYLLLLSVCLGLWSCDDRRDLIDLGENWEKTLAVKVKIDWSKAGINPENASIWIFNASDGTPALGGRPELTNRMELTVDLPIGQYSILVFNGAINDQDHIRFRGTDRYRTFEAYAYDETPEGNAAARLRADEDLSFITPPNVLAADHLDLLEITGRMIDRKEETLITFTPRRLVSQINITVHFRGLNYSAPGGHSGVVTGMANSIFLATGKTGNEPANHAFTLNNRTFYPDSQTDGTMSRSFLTFGLPGMTYNPLQFGETNNRLLLDILLRNNEHATYSIDVTGGVVSSGSNDAATGLNLLITLGGGNLSLPPVMHDPVTLPEVPEVDFSDGGGFDPDVNDWGEIIDLPMPVD
ncbi:MAG: DUF5119 domain-containing protein [Dysgonamonadaceae bacterium]|jgi:hypothetical protein|nr:DUF5119 domain-containing protein [Dysgonamonadaceae bacterium]